MTTAVTSLKFRAPGRLAVGWWLLVLALVIAAMVTLGGLTRLTGSGLSITEWKPVMGVVPPLSDAAWQSEFAKYQRIPQYRLENRGMSLDGFKAIYWWEWTHRFLGRLLGFVFLLPFLYFAFTGAIARAQFPRMLLLFALGGLQGFVGWWMVESGLETRVSVSQYRLAIHLGVAIILLGAILWTAFEYLRPKVFDERTADLERFQIGRNHKLSPWPARRPAMESEGSASASNHSENARVALRKRIRVGGFLFVGLVYVQMLLGALVAGLHAGLIYNTWPSMDGRVFPEHPFFAAPWWTNFFENAGLAQFDHRVGTYIVALSAFALWMAGRRAKLEGLARRSSDALLGLTAFQIILGIVTLVSQAPVALAAAHQATAVALFSAAIWHAHEVSGVRGVQPAASA